MKLRVDAAVIDFKKILLLTALMMPEHLVIYPELLDLNGITLRWAIMGSPAIERRHVPMYVHMQ
eukprot:2825107-Ditylum_brightwellii.AAC.1